MVRFKSFIILLIFINNLSLILSEENNYCWNKDVCQNSFNQNRYVFYDINPPEGFNLRRDVYLRYAVFAHKMNKSEDNMLNEVKIVLPPWSNLYHWRTEKSDEKFPWSYFFDLQSLKLFAPVIEMYEFFEELGPQYTKVIIDEVYILQHFEDMFKTNNFEDRMSIEPCSHIIQTNFFYYQNITSKNIKCLSFHGKVSDLSKILKDSQSKTFLFDHAEVALHDHFGDKLYWQARRSMRFNKDLVKIANSFRKHYLNSSDESDNTKRPSDWRNEKPKRDAVGGQYLSVHMRRRDFIRVRSKQTPSLKFASKQIEIILKELNLNTVFVATDAPQKEFEEFRKYFGPKYTVFRFNPTRDIEETYGPGGVAIIDQIICSHARYFMGTYESTFSFRIQEEREILGFPERTTFNRLCGDEEGLECSEPSAWKIVF